MRARSARGSDGCASASASSSGGERATATSGAAWTNASCAPWRRVRGSPRASCIIGAVRLVRMVVVAVVCAVGSGRVRSRARERLRDIPHAVRQHRLWVHHGLWTGDAPLRHPVRAETGASTSRVNSTGRASPWAVARRGRRAPAIPSTTGRARVLKYGSAWKRGPFTCISLLIGLSCANSSGSRLLPLQGTLGRRLGDGAAVRPRPSLPVRRPRAGRDGVLQDVRRHRVVEGSPRSR